ncbi:MAG: aspartate 1-decarboxylase [Candidatus Gastranaerophilales bacterium]|nr:aspartate 1-decarboxylase [Candidatus Gastranaerophilales bacterium]
MLNEFLYAKIHRATVTEANLDYVGSITIDKTLLDEVGIKKNQKVEILDINNGERFSTYVIEGAANSGIVCLNGAAARKVQVKDKIIIVAYALLNEEEQQTFEPKIAHVDGNNKLIK